MSENLDKQESEDTANNEVEVAEPPSLPLTDPTEVNQEPAHTQSSSPRVARSASNQSSNSTNTMNKKNRNQSGSPITPHSSKGNRRQPRARRMNLSITRLDAWSVAKVSFMLGVAGGIIQVVAVAVLWGVLSVIGVFDQLTQIFSSTGLDASSFDLTDIFSLSTVLSAVTIFSVIEVVLFTLLITIIALLYNVVSALVGGIHVTLGDD